VLLKRIKKARRILEVGCGDGYLLGLVSPLCDVVVGIDADQTATQLASDKLKYIANATVLQADCYQLPCAQAAFDVVLLADVIEHLPNPDACLQEACRTLTPGGRVLITTPQWQPTGARDPYHYKEYKPGELVELLARYFSSVVMVFFWPRHWHIAYSSSTRIGRKLIRIFSRHFYNPFLREGSDNRRYAMMLAVCEQPRSCAERIL